MSKKSIRLLVTAAVLWFSSDMPGAQIAPPPSSLTGRSIPAIGYLVGGGATTVDLQNTGLMAHCGGLARVEATPGVSTVEVNLKGLKPPTELSAEFLT